MTLKVWAIIVGTILMSVGVFEMYRFSVDVPEKGAYDVLGHYVDAFWACQLPAIGIGIALVVIGVVAHHPSGSSSDRQESRSNLSKDELLQITVEVARGERDRSDLKKYGITLGPFRALNEQEKIALLRERMLDDEDPNAPDFVRAHKHCRRNRSEINANETCACFHCLRRLQPQAVHEWHDGETALCPHCGVDAIIGSASGFAPTDTLLSQMRNRWFHDEPMTGEQQPRPE